MRKAMGREAGMARTFPLLFQPRTVREIAGELGSSVSSAQVYIRGLVDMRLVKQIDKRRIGKTKAVEFIYLAVPGATWAGQTSITGMDAAMIADHCMRAMVAYGKEQRI